MLKGNFAITVNGRLTWVDRTRPQEWQGLVDHTIACYALKGGVGKTSTAVNIAWLAAADGCRTLLWDVDPQGAATFLLGGKPKLKGGARNLLQGETDPRNVVRRTKWERLDLVPAEPMYESADLDLDAAKKSGQRVERVLRGVRDAYDLVVLDCPPGLSLLSENIVRAADLLLVPLVPSPLSLRSLDHVVDFVHATSPEDTAVLAFLSMVDGRRAMHRQTAALVSDHVARTQIPVSAIVERMGERRAPVVAWAPRSAPAQAYRNLWLEVRSRIDLTPAR